MTPPVRVFLADDHPVVREGLKHLIDAEPDLAVVGEAADGPAALVGVADRNPDVVVVDVSLPGMSGAEVTTRLRQATPGRRVLALTVHEDRAYVRLMVEAGAAGYVVKRVAADELIRAIRVVAAGGTYLDPALVAPPADPLTVTPAGTGGADLSDREVEVLKQIARGFSNKEIAARLGLSIKTVETYKTRSLEKLGLRSRVDIVRHAARHGWLADA